MRLTRLFGDDAPTPVLYDRALFELALGDPRAASRSLAVFVRRSRARGDVDALATGLRTTGYALRLVGRIDEAREAVAASLETASPESGHVVRGVALAAALDHDRGELDLAAEGFRRIRALGDTPVARRGLWEAELAIARGELDRAEGLATQNLEVCLAREWPGHVAHAHAVLGRVAAARDEDGAPHMAEVAAWTDRTGEVEMVLRGHHLEAALGDPSARERLESLAARLGYALAPIGG